MNRRNDIVWDKIMERPVLPLALYMMAALMLTYAFASLIPQGIIAIAVLLLVLMEYRKCGDYALFVLLTVILSMASGYLMTVKLTIPADERYYMGNIRIDSTEHKLSGRAVTYVTLDDGTSAVIYSDNDRFWPSGGSFYGQGRLREPKKATNPGVFDSREYLNKRGVRFVLTLTDEPGEVHSGIISGAGGAADRALFSVRKALYSTVREHTGSDSSALAAAICLGDPSLLDPQVRTNFSLTSCSHLIAVSGTHFNAIMTVITFVMSSIDKRKKHTVTAIICCLMIALVTGFRESVTRAFVMNLCLIMSRDKLSGLSLGVIIMLISDPFAVMSQGLLLSVAGSFGIMFFAPSIRQRLVVMGAKQFISDALSVMAGAHLGLLPFYGFYGIRISPVNYLCQFIGSFIVTCMCMVFIPVMILISLKMSFAAYALELLAGSLTSLIKYCSSLSYLSINCGRYGKYIFVIFYISVLVLFMPDGVVRRAMKKPCFAAFALALGLMLYKLLFPPAAEIIFLDVGQGDCCLMIMGGDSVLIDGGTHENGEELSEVLNWYGIDKVGMAVVTHWDEDHYGGISYLYREGRISEVLAPDNCTLDQKDPLYIGEITVGRSGDVLTAGDNTFEIIWPYSVTDGGNEDSIVMEAHIGDCTVLFTGDIGEETENKLIELGMAGDCDILKVAHHGSKYSSSQAYIRAVKPETAVISCGKNNSYGHPHGEVVEILRENCVNIRRTDLEGAISFEIN